MKSISIFGTSSDAGKSTLTFVIGRLLQERGFNVGVFKAQNVSNNSRVCDDGSEIAIAQYFQAEVLGIPTSYHLNPILLKSGQGNSASLIVKGKAVMDKDVRDYYRDLDTLKPAVDECFEYLRGRYDCVVCEGAGSPVELNLMDKDLSNLYIAEKYGTKIILVADIEKGGVFASIWGVYNLLPEILRANVIGVIVNKFRGDRTLFDEGVKIIEERFGIPVLGVLPYLPLNLGFEDSQSLKNFVQNKPHPARKIGIIAYPTMSNYNDFEPLIADESIFVEFITSNVSLDSFDTVILPGSKRVIEDLRWLKQTGLFDALKERTKEILGICGGYQMMFKAIIDEEGVETAASDREEGLGFIDDVIVFQREKVLNKGKYDIFGRAARGFEIHHGVSVKYPLSYENAHIKGTFVHGLFEDEKFENYKKMTLDSFIATMRDEIDMERILKHVV
ncbi:MAG: cobalamin biosynthesis protein CobQ [Sulfuricurvum sp. MLSB]|uniref:cobyric acid synthase n=1 Tax=unclassified Sulfuricurvum TaxID=2632390 RepID=UPI0005026C76|nr:MULTISPECIES: cobyric acid synthase [unclassified Sulfuricurvum]KFN38789.1 MAG: cobalamin biosynthesis protein CobQ [Sulfuricurvum sp. MLSB]